jgi:multiple sugar transport system permease protein
MRTDNNVKAKIARSGRIKTAVTYLLLSIWAILVIFPFYWMMLTSFKSYSSYNAEYVPRLYTSAPTFQNYADAFTQVPLGRYFLNSIIFTLVTTALMLIVITLAAYAFARMDFPGKDLVFTVFLSLMMIPAELVIITNFVTITDLRLRNTFLGLILPSVTSVFYIYLLKENFEQVPEELYKAARVDGTSDFMYLIRVMIPVCQPTMVTITILKVIECWNSYVWPRLITSEVEGQKSYFLVSNAIEAMRNSGFGKSNMPAMMAAVVIVSIPLLILFAIFRNQIMSGVARTGTKG